MSLPICVQNIANEYSNYSSSQKESSKECNPNQKAIEINEKNTLVTLTDYIGKELLYWSPNLVASAVNHPILNVGVSSLYSGLMIYSGAQGIYHASQHKVKNSLSFRSTALKTAMLLQGCLTLSRLAIEDPRLNIAITLGQTLFASKAVVDGLGLIHQSGLVGVLVTRIKNFSQKLMRQNTAEVNKEQIQSSINWVETLAGILSLGLGSYRLYNIFSSEGNTDSQEKDKIIEIVEEPVEKNKRLSEEIIRELRNPSKEINSENCQSAHQKAEKLDKVNITPTLETLFTHFKDNEAGPSILESLMKIKLEITSKAHCELYKLAFRCKNFEIGKWAQDLFDEVLKNNFVGNEEMWKRYCKEKVESKPPGRLF